MHPSVSALAVVTLMACGATDPTDAWSGDRDRLLDPVPLGVPLDELPLDLADTGLCADASCATITTGVVPFTPRWHLWSDGATKQRWIWVPPGAQIDNHDPDAWVFPVGTKLWKEFVRDGVRVETRYMAKYGEADDAWLFGAYEWTADGAGAVLMMDGDSDVNGTPHDIPAARACTGCHGNTKARVLGFSLFQTDVDAAWDAGWLQTAPPALTVPGNETEVAALGYFHANCGHCHNSKSPLINRPSLRLESGFLSSVTATKTYKTTVNVQGATFGGATIIAKPGDPDRSIIVTRMTAADPKKRMPALGIEIVDPDGLAAVRRWIQSL